MIYPCWAEPTDDVLAQIILSEEDYCALEPSDDPPEYTEQVRASAIESLYAAQGILSLLAGGHIHGAGTATDVYVLNGPVHRVSTTFRPIREIHSAEIISEQGSVLQTLTLGPYGQIAFVDRSLINFRSPCRDRGMLRITYDFGSTLTIAARTTLLYYARQLFLAGPCGDRSLCELPERVTSISREGISMSLIDPQTFIDKGRTGLIRVDQWLSTYLSRKGMGRPGVFSADAPPPSNVMVRCR